MAQSRQVLTLLFSIALISRVFSYKLHKQIDHKKRIVNGITTDIKDAKFYAHLVCADESSLCGATLVTDDRLITAAHCMLTCKGQPKVYVGMNSRQNYQNNAKSYDVAKVVSHPNYEHNTKKFYYDIAVVHLHTKVERNDVVQPISYATTPVPIGQHVVCYGYGPTSRNSLDMSNTLQRAQFTAKYYDRDVLTVSTGSSTIRPGDSGGPCISNNQLVAEIVSYAFTKPENGLVMTGHPEILTFLQSQGL